MLVKARGHGKRNRCWTDKYGFPIRHAPRKKFEKGFRTGDIVRADIPKGKHQGKHTGRVAIRFGQDFQLGKVSVHPRHCRAIHRADGYTYTFGETQTSSQAQCDSGSSPGLKPGVSAYAELLFGDDGSGSDRTLERRKPFTSLDGTQRHRA